MPYAQPTATRTTGVTVAIKVSFISKKTMSPSVQIEVITTVRRGRTTPPNRLKDKYRHMMSTSRTKGMRNIKSFDMFLLNNTAMTGKPAR
jgi:hypothetical protein